MSTLNEDLLRQLQEINQKRARSNQLRQAQTQLQTMGQTELKSGRPEAQRGPLFDTVERWQYDVGGAAKQAVGAIGNYLVGKKADQAEVDLNDAIGQGSMGALQKIGEQQAAQKAGTATDPNQPNIQALQGYLQLAGGPDMAKLATDAASRSPTTSGRQVDRDGNVWTQMNDGTWHKAPFQANQNIRWIDNGFGESVPVGASIAGSTMLGGSPGPQPQGPSGPQGPQGPAPAPASPQPQGQSVPSGGGNSRYHEAVMGIETGGHKDPSTAVSPKGAYGPMQLMPDTAADLEKRNGLPPGSHKNPAINVMLGQQYYDEQLAEFGDPTVAAVAYNMGPTATRKWIANGSNPAELPEETRNYVQKFQQRVAGNAGAPVSGGQPSGAAAAVQQYLGTGGPAPIRTASPEERARQTATGKARGEADTAALAAETARQVTLGTEQGKNQAKFQEALPQVERLTTQIDGAISALEESEGLGKIVGDTMIGRLKDVRDEKDPWWWPTADNVVTTAFAGTPVADSYAKYQHLQAANFLKAFQDLKGGGQITVEEGNKAEKAFARLQRAQSEEAFREALATAREVANEILMSARERARTGYSAGEFMVPAAPVPAAAPPQSSLPTGWSVRVK